MDATKVKEICQILINLGLVSECIVGNTNNGLKFDFQIDSGVKKVMYVPRHVINSANLSADDIAKAINRTLLFELKKEAN